MYFAPHERASFVRSVCHPLVYRAMSFLSLTNYFPVRRIFSNTSNVALAAIAVSAMGSKLNIPLIHGPKPTIELL